MRRRDCFNPTKTLTNSSTIETTEERDINRNNRRKSSQLVIKDSSILAAEGESLKTKIGRKSLSISSADNDLSKEREKRGRNLLSSSRMNRERSKKNTLDGNR